MRLVKKGSEPIASAPYAQLNQGSEDHVEVAFGAGMQDMGSQPERAGRRVHVSRLCLRNGRIGRIDQHGHGGRRRDHFMQQLQLLRPNLHAQHGYARKVAAWPVEAGDKFHLDRIDACQKDDRNRSGRRLCGQRRRSIRDDHGHLSANQIGRQHRESVVPILRETVFNNDVLALDIARFFQALAKRRQDICILAGPPAVEKSDHRQRRLLRARRDWPRRRAAENGDERAASQLIELHSSRQLGPRS